MKIEMLNVRIFISKNTVAADAIGNRKNVWQPYYTCYATVSAEGGKQRNLRRRQAAEENTTGGLFVQKTGPSCCVYELLHQG